MKELVIRDDYGVFADGDKKIKCDSLFVAKMFNKQHKNVLQAIKNLGCSNDFTELNFELSKYKDITGRKLPYYKMTRDGFMLLVMGYTGEFAMQIKRERMLDF